MAENNKLFQIHVIVIGRVQGVSFRYYTVEYARRLGLVGWVRNRPDGSVEVVAVGTKPQLEDLLSFLPDGSPTSRVQSVQVEWQTPVEDFINFDVRYFAR